MDLYLYIILFIIGSLFGSFYTLAVYRIPKRQDITHTHSYCPNCNHKLGLFDLIPILSYIFLGGKCRYCKQKIRPRYFILEILSGISFVLLAYVMKLDINTINAIEIAEYSFYVLFITYIILLVGIDKENRNINKPVNIYGVVISIMYMVYLCIVEKANIYRYGIYLILYIVVILLDTVTLKKYAKSTYTNGIIIMLLNMIIFTGEYITATTVIFALLTIAIYILLSKLQTLKSRNRKTDKQIYNELSIGFYLGVSNLIIFLFALYYMTYIA